MNDFTPEQGIVMLKAALALTADAKSLISAAILMGNKDSICYDLRGARHAASAAQSLYTLATDRVRESKENFEFGDSMAGNAI